MVELKAILANVSIKRESDSVVKLEVSSDNIEEVKQLITMTGVVLKVQITPEGPANFGRSADGR